MLSFATLLWFATDKTIDEDTDHTWEHYLPTDKANVGMDVFKLGDRFMELKRPLWYRTKKEIDDNGDSVVQDPDSDWDLEVEKMAKAPKASAAASSASSASAASAPPPPPPSPFPPFPPPIPTSPPNATASSPPNATRVWTSTRTSAV